MPRSFKTVYRPTKEDRAETKRLRDEALRNAEALLSPAEREAYQAYFVPGGKYSEQEKMACLQRARTKVAFQQLHGASEDAKTVEQHKAELGYGLG